MELITDILKPIFGGTGSRLWPLYLPSMIALAYLVYRRERRSDGFWAWLFPRRIYFHKSHIVDLKLFIFGRALAFIGIAKKLAITTTVVVLVIHLMGGTLTENNDMSPWILALIILIGSDFSTYWIHRIHHEHKTLWPFHAVHHSAEVMTPLTVYRKHPIYDLLGSTLRGLILGLIQGFLLALFVSEISVALLFGTNVFYAVFNATAANLRHSHVWLSFGPVMEHLFISPAQHQVHHSIEKRHYNKNYGEVLAIWDWMFGTLYVCENRENLTFGLGDDDGNPVEQPHTTLAAALWVPFKESWATIRKPKRPETETPPYAGPAE